LGISENPSGQHKKGEHLAIDPEDSKEGAGNSSEEVPRRTTNRGSVGKNELDLSGKTEFIEEVTR